MKTCGRCKESKIASEFHRASNTKDGLHTICKPCRRGHQSDYYAEKHPSATAARAEREAKAGLLAKGLQRCARCREDKPLREFGPRAASLSGRNNYCKSCEVVRVRRWARDNPDKYRATVAVQNMRNRGRLGVSDATREYVAVLYRDPCCYCGSMAEHIDHISPVSLVPSYEWDNLTAACASCNMAKHATPMLHFMLRLQVESQLELV